MGSSIEKALSAAVLRLLRPLVRVLLRNGVSHGAFAELAKWVYVDVATREFGVAGRKQSVSRVAVLTGLTRKEVTRQQGIAAPDDAVAAQQYNRAARVIGGWMRDTRFHDAQGEAAPLPMEGAVSFSALVKAYSGDMPARAVLDELLRVGAVERRPDGSIGLLQRGYVPRGGEADKLHILGTDVADLIATIDHNLKGSGAARFQRKVAYDNLPVEALPALRRMTDRQGQALLETLDAYLAQQDRDSNPASQGSGRKRAGVAIYYFEDDVPDENDKDS